MEYIFYIYFLLISSCKYIHCNRSTDSLTVWSGVTQSEHVIPRIDF